MAVIFAKPI